jgi:periplasmic protein TonB
VSQTRIGPGDRLGLTIILATLLHAVIVLGITFDDELKPSAALPSLDVILVQSHSNEAPDQADYLAQANQKGGGDSDKRKRPSDAFSGELPTPDDGIAPVPIKRQSKAPQLPLDEPLSVIVQRQSTLRANSGKPKDKIAPQPRPVADEDMATEIEAAKLAAELRLKQEAYAKRPRRKAISANTREYAPAQYMSAWVAMVERVATYNYPEESKRKNIYGEVILTVGVRRDGSIEKVEVIHSSGHPILDDAALRIVQMAGPFQPLPNLLDEQGRMIDILDITRTWRFRENNKLEFE